MSKTIEQAAEEYSHKKAQVFRPTAKDGFIIGAKSEAAKDYWYRQFEAEKIKARIETIEMILNCYNLSSAEISDLRLTIDRLNKNVD
jgi:hypothetical protein